MEIGSRIGAYEIRERIAEGGMATVYKAWHLGLHRFEALKVPRRQYPYGDSEFIHRLLAEARTSAQLHHPHIVAIHNVSEPDAEQHFFAMDLVVGYDLAKLLEWRGRLSITEALPILRQIGSALDYAHAHGIIHRDIKPGNILLQEVSEQGGWMAKVVDFGISRAADNGDTKLTIDGMILGTAEYMSPEQSGNGNPVDYRTDIYSLGIVTYEMLCGKVPFSAGEGASRMSVLMSHMHAAPRAPMNEIPGLPIAANNAVLKSLAKHPDQRFSSCADFMKALSGAVTVTPPPLPEGDGLVEPPAALPSHSASPRASNSHVAAAASSPLTPAAHSQNGSEVTPFDTASGRARMSAAEPPPATPVPAAPVSVPGQASMPVQADIPSRTPAPIKTVSVGEEKSRTNWRPFALGAGGLAVVLVAASSLLRGRNENAPVQSAAPMASVAPSPTAIPSAAPTPTAVVGRNAGRNVTQLTEKQPIAFARQKRFTPDLKKGEQKVQQKGEPGVKEVTLEITYQGVREVNRRSITKIIKAPKPEIVMVGGNASIDPILGEGTEEETTAGGTSSGYRPKKRYNVSSQSKRRKRTRRNSGSNSSGGSSTRVREAPPPIIEAPPPSP